MAPAVAKEVFHARGIGADQLPPASGPHLPMDEAAESKRAASVERNVGPVSPGVVQYTSDPLFMTCGGARRSRRETAAW